MSSRQEPIDPDRQPGRGPRITATPTTVVYELAIQGLPKPGALVLHCHRDGEILVRILKGTSAC